MEEAFERMRRAGAYECPGWHIQSLPSLGGWLPTPVTRANFAGAYFRAGPSCEGVAFEGAVTFRDAVFSAERRIENFTKAEFLGPSDFAGAKFYAGRFEQAKFEGPTTFERAHFDQAANFKHAVFNRDTSFAGASFHWHAWFEHARFGGTADFSGSDLEGWANFSDAVFEGKASFDRAKSSDPAGVDFVRATFRGDASFNRSIFEHGPWFKDATFAGRIAIRFTVFRDSEWRKNNKGLLELAKSQTDAARRRSKSSSRATSGCPESIESLLSECRWPGERGRNAHRLLVDQLRTGSPLPLDCHWHLVRSFAFYGKEANPSEVGPYSERLVKEYADAAIPLLESLLLREDLDLDRFDVDATLFQVVSLNPQRVSQMAASLLQTIPASEASGPIGEGQQIEALGRLAANAAPLLALHYRQSPAEQIPVHWYTCLRPVPGDIPLQMLFLGHRGRGHLVPFFQFLLPAQTLPLLRRVIVEDWGDAFIDLAAQTPYAQPHLDVLWTAVMTDGTPAERQFMQRRGRRLLDTQ